VFGREDHVHEQLGKGLRHGISRAPSGRNEGKYPKSQGFALGIRLAPRWGWGAATCRPCGAGG
jgi:hypothetical protein